MGQSRHRQEVAALNAAFDIERAGREAALLVAHHPALEARRELNQLRYDMSTLRRQAAATAAPS